MHFFPLAQANEYTFKHITSAMDYHRTMYVLLYKIQEGLCGLLLLTV